MVSKPTRKAKLTQPAPAENVQPVVLRREREKDIFKWRARVRAFKKRTREYWVSVIAIAAMASFILFIIEGTVSVLLVIAVVFLFYILSSVEPEVVEYAITNRGIKIADHKTSMDTLIRFWFGKHHDEDVLVFETFTIPGRLELVINGKDKNSIRNALSTYLQEEKASPDKLDKTVDWLSQKLPMKK